MLREGKRLIATKIPVGILREFLHGFCTGLSRLQFACEMAWKICVFVQGFLPCAFFVNNKSRYIVVSCRNDCFILDGSEIPFGECAQLSQVVAGTAGWQWWVYGPFVVNRFGRWSVAIAAKNGFPTLFTKKMGGEW